MAHLWVRSFLSQGGLRQGSAGLLPHNSASAKLWPR